MTGKDETLNDEEMDTIDDTIGGMLSALDLEHETCGLKHSSEDPAENHDAVDYLCQKIGDPETGTGLYELRIPICEECHEALHDPGWILVYCVNCLKSQWICRRLAKNKYPNGNLIYWLDTCPFCAKVADEMYGE